MNDVDQDRNYQLFVTESPSNKKELGPNYIKLFLSDLKDEALPNYDSNIIPSLTKLNYIKDKPNSRLILRGTIGPKKHINVKLRSWISESFVISEGNNSFSYDLGVRAVK